MRRLYKLECRVDSFESADAAKKGGADRLELCAGAAAGGLTPSPVLFEEIKRRLNIRTHVLIRPRLGDFLYTQEEAMLICKEIRMFKQAGADGIAVGSLNPDGSLNMEQMRRFADCAGDMSITLHRAFDGCKNQETALLQAKQLGIKAVLTSGQADCAVVGISCLKGLVRMAGEGVTIFADGGIDAKSAKALTGQAGLTAFHMSGRRVRPSGMIYRNTEISIGLPVLNGYENWETDEEEVRAVRNVLDEARLQGFLTL